MLQTICQKFSGGCMMVMRQHGETASFLGTAFLVHEDGYLLTVAHILPKEGNLLVVPGDPGSDFVSVSQKRVTTLPVSIAQRNPDRDVALLRIDQQTEMRLPDHFLGTAENMYLGNSIMAMGYSFGHQTLHTLVAMNAVICAKILSNNQSRLLLFDSMVHDGDRGGPLISVGDGLVVGIINGRFDPQEAAGEYTDGSRTVTAITNISYAIAIEYGIELMEKEGLKAH
ncbi:MAG: serine protease [Desulfobulbaceae bacterium]|nr:serine protease [Desulfobulbaceae bacterium]